MTVEQLLAMEPGAAMAWVRENRATFEFVPVTPSDEMIKAAAGPDFSQEDRELVTREWVDMIATHRHGLALEGKRQAEQQKAYGNREQLVNRTLLMVVIGIAVGIVIGLFV